MMRRRRSSTKWETDATTVGGMVIRGARPPAGSQENVTIGDYEFEVERVGERVIESVLASRLESTPPEAES